MKILKYTLDNEQGTAQAFAIPKDSEVLSVGVQDNKVQIWVKVSDLNFLSERTFSMFETGKHIPATPMKFIGTALLYNGMYVVHVFEVLK